MINILIADDDVDVRTGLAEVLRQNVLNINIVAVCKNGKEILDIVKNHQIDLIISDVKMPEMSGLQMSREVHALHPDIQIILISAYAEFGYAQEAMQYGVRHYILKPMTYDKIDEICSIINKISEEKENHNSFRDMVHELSFRNMIKKAFESKSREDILAVFEIVDNKRVPSSDFYLYIISILKELLAEKDAEHILYGEELSAVEFKNDENEYREFVLGCYEKLQDFMKTKEVGEMSLFERIKNYVDTNFTSVSCSTCDIAENFNISEVYLCRIFKQNKQRTLMDYIVDKRIELAKTLLEDDLLLTRDVALKVGYENEKYFYSVFKKRVGISPSQYKQSIKEGEKT